MLYANIKRGEQTLKKTEIAACEAGSLAAQAGLQAGDVILSINGETFSDVLEYDEDYGGNLGRTDSVRAAVCMGAGALPDSGETVVLSALYSAYDASVSGDHALGVSGAQPIAFDGQSLGNHCAGGIFYLFGVSYVPLFFYDTGGTVGSGAHGWSRRMENFFYGRNPTWKVRNFVGAGTAVSGKFQYD